jgi:hypothetical protein
MANAARGQRPGRRADDLTVFPIALGCMGMKSVGPSYDEHPLRPLTHQR